MFRDVGKGGIMYIEDCKVDGLRVMDFTLSNFKGGGIHTKTRHAK